MQYPNSKDSQNDAFEWDPSHSVTTAWSSTTTTQQRSSKVRRTYGRRRGSNDYDYVSSSLSRQRSDLFDSKDSIEEADTSQTSSSFSSDSIHEKGSELSSSANDNNSNSQFIGSDALCPPPIKRGVPPLRPSKKLHKRSMSLSLPPPVPKPSGFLKRSSTLQTNNSIEQQQHQLEEPPPPLRHRSSSISTLSGHRSSVSSSDSSSFFDWKENSHPNFENLREVTSPLPPEFSARKRVRARRSSITIGGSSVPPPRSGLKASHRRSSMGNLGGSSSSSSSPPTSLFSEIARSASVGGGGAGASGDNVMGGGLCWMNNLARQASLSPQKLPPSSVSGLDFGDDSSPSARSVATSVGSSRKRGMADEPSDHDADDTGSVVSFSVPRTSFANNKATIAANRLFSPTSSSFEATTTTTTNSSMNNINMGATFVPIDLGYSDDGFQRKGRVMDLESDREEYDSEVEDEDDSSVESMSEESDSEEDVTDRSSSNNDFSHYVSESCMGMVRSEEDVLASMSSYEDLKFLIKALRQERKKETRKPMFGATLGCTIAPPHAWAPDRRNGFIRWTNKNLGFSVRAAGPAVAFLQISRPKGMETLTLLELALILKKKREQEGHSSVTPAADQSLSTVITTTGTAFASKTQFSTERGDSPVVPEPPTSILRSGSAAADMLIDSMNALSFKEKDASSLTRHVTLDERDSVARLDRNNLDLSPTIETSRPSTDSRCSSHFGAEQDFMVHLHGLSPASSCRPSRPPKMSLCSVTSTVSNPRHVETTPISTGLMGPTSAQLTFDFVETPLMKQPYQGWGSRPIQGKDWGASDRCNEHTTRMLIKLMNAAFTEAGLEHECEPTIGMSPLPSRSSTLCFDMEADGSEGCDLDDSDDEETDRFFPMVDKKMGDSFVGVAENENLPSAEKMRNIRRRNVSLAKHRRMSVCVSTARPAPLPQRKSMFDSKRKSFMPAPNGELYQREQFFRSDSGSHEPLAAEQPPVEVLAEQNLLQSIFSFLEGHDLLTTVPLVCTTWSQASTDAYADLVLASVGCQEVDASEDCDDDDEPCDMEEPQPLNSIAQSMQRSWKHLLTTFPYGSFLSEGAFKRVYKVKNAVVNDVEAVSIMDVNLIESTGNKAVVGTELAVSVMLSSLARRGICPNFVITRGVFTCPYEPPASHWGSAENKNHEVHVKSPKKKRLPREPSAKHRGNFQCIRMELCEEGDAEEFIKRQPNETVSIELARILLCQVAFALHAAGAKYSLKHYDMKLLNIFLANAKTDATGDVVLRYGLGSKTFAMRMPAENALIAKLADYGTADVKSETNGQPVSLAQITTLENTPPDFFILGDHAKQGHSHDMFGLGLCMLHLFTGKAPYEEILEDVHCPAFFKELLQGLWEDERVNGYTVLRSVILSEVYKDADGNIVEGEPDETFYDTFYRYIVLFGVPEETFQRKLGSKVWRIIGEAIESSSGTGRSGRSSRPGKEASQFAKDRKKYSLSHGTNKYIARARRSLESTNGGMELLLSLVSFDPDKRATALDVLNSEFFEPLTESPGTRYRQNDDVRSFMAFSMSS